MEPSDVPRYSGRSSQEFAGWLDFAGTMIIVVGGFHLLQGLVALFKDDYFLVTKENILLFDYTTWGWILVCLGVLGILVGLSVIADKTWARVTGVVLAIFAILTQLGFLAAFPIWSVLTISLGVVVIYALLVGSSHAVGER